MKRLIILSVCSFFAVGSASALTMTNSVSYSSTSSGTSYSSYSGSTFTSSSLGGSSYSSSGTGPVTITNTVNTVLTNTNTVNVEGSSTVIVNNYNPWYCPPDPEQEVPEPGTLLLLGSAGLLAKLRKRLPQAA